MKPYLTIRTQQARSLPRLFPNCLTPAELGDCTLQATWRMKTNAGLGLGQGFLCHLLDNPHSYQQLFIRPEPVGCQLLLKALMPQMEGLLAVLIMTRISGKQHFTVTIRTSLISNNSHAEYCALEAQREYKVTPLRRCHKNLVLSFEAKTLRLRGVPSGNRQCIPPNFNKFLY